MEGSYCKHVFTASKEGEVMPDIEGFKIAVIFVLFILVTWLVFAYPSLSNEGRAKAIGVIAGSILTAFGVAAYN